MLSREYLLCIIGDCSECKEYSLGTHSLLPVSPSHIKQGGLHVNLGRNCSRKILKYGTSKEVLEYKGKINRNVYKE